MELLLVRHGHAVDDAPGLGDTGRWLSAKGRKVTRRVARWLAESKKRRPALIWTSPLVRATQTAEILAVVTGYKGEVRALSELSPGRDPGDLKKLLEEAHVEGPLALVGHEPSLSLLVTALLGDIGFEGFKKSGVLAISWENGQGRAKFLLDPSGMQLTKKGELQQGKRGGAEREPAAPSSEK